MSETESGAQPKRQCVADDSRADLPCYPRGIRAVTSRPIATTATAVQSTRAAALAGDAASALQQEVALLRDQVRELSAENTRLRQVRPPLSPPTGHQLIVAPASSNEAVMTQKVCAPSWRWRG